MPRLGAHTFIWSAEWSTEAVSRIMPVAAAAALDVVEIPLLRPDEIDIDTTVALAREHGVAVTCSLGLPQHATLPDHPAEAEAFLKIRAGCGRPAGFPLPDRRDLQQRSAS